MSHTHRIIAVALLITTAGCAADDPVSTPDAATDMSSTDRDTATAPDAATAVTPDTSTRDLGGPADMAQPTDGGTDTGAAADMGTTPDTAQGDMGFCPDGYEPNNVVAEATPVSSGDTISAVNCGFDDDDVYSIALTAGDEITLTHSFTNSSGNLDLNLHAPSQMGQVGKTGSTAAITFSFEDVETLTHVAEETGTYYILSFNNNDSQNAYTLAITVQ